MYNVNNIDQFIINNDVLGRIEWNDTVLQGNSFGDTWRTENWSKVKQQLNKSQNSKGNQQVHNNHNKPKDKAIKIQELSNIYLTRSLHYNQENRFKKDIDHPKKQYHHLTLAMMM